MWVCFSVSLTNYKRNILIGRKHTGRILLDAPSWHLNHSEIYQIAGSKNPPTSFLAEKMQAAAEAVEITLRCSQSMLQEIIPA